MVQVLVDPVVKKLEPPEVDDKSVLIGFVAPKCNRDRPVMSMDVRAVPVVQVLAVSPRNVAKSLLAGDHTGTLFLLSAIVSVDGAVDLYRGSP